MDDIAMAVKPFIMLTTNGDLPTNWMRLGECMVCGEVFTREQSRKHSEARCHPSPDQPLSIKGRGSKSEHKNSNMAIMPNIPDKVQIRLTFSHLLGGIDPRIARTLSKVDRTNAGRAPERDPHARGGLQPRRCRRRGVVARAPP